MRKRPIGPEWGLPGANCYFWRHFIGGAPLMMTSQLSAGLRAGSPAAPAPFDSLQNQLKAQARRRSLHHFTADDEDSVLFPNSGHIIRSDWSATRVAPASREIAGQRRPRAGREKVSRSCWLWAGPIRVAAAARNLHEPIDCCLAPLAHGARRTARPSHAKSGPGQAQRSRRLKLGPLPARAQGRGRG